MGKALPDTVIRQLDERLPLLGPAGRAGAITAADLQAMHRSDLPDPARHRAAPRRSGQPAHRLPGGHRRPAQPDLRQPQGRTDAPPAADHHRDRRSGDDLAAAARSCYRPHRPASLAVPQPAATGQTIPRAPDRHSVGRAFKVWVARSAPSTANCSDPTAPGPVRPVPGHPIRTAPQLRPKPRRCRGTGRRAARAHGSRRGSHHDGLLLESVSNANNRRSARSGRWPSTPPETRPRSPVPPPTSGPRCRCRSATAPNRPTSKPAAAPARSASSAPAAASTAPTRPTCPPSSSTSPPCAPTGRPPRRSAPPTT